MNRTADPGGVFASDAHRRVLGHLRVPHEEDGNLSLEPGHGKESLRGRLVNDPHFSGDVDTILAELVDDGYVERNDPHLRMTNKGLAALTGPNSPEPPPMSEAQVTALHEAGEIDDDALAAWQAVVDGAKS